MNRRLNAGLVLVVLISLLAVGCLGGSTKKDPVVHTLTIETHGEGTVDPSGKTHKISDQAAVTLTAQPAEGWELEEWIIGERVETDQKVSFLMTGDLMVIAVFKEVNDPSPPDDDPVSYKLIINKTGEGTITPNPGTHKFDAGTMVELKAEPAENWEFEKWIINGVDNTNRDVTVLLDKNFTATALFKEVEEETIKYTLTITVEGQGTVTPQPGTYEHDEDAYVSLTAEPAEGWEFSGWKITGGFNEQNIPNISTFLIMDNDRQVKATFKEIATTTLTINVIGQGTVTPGEGVHTIPKGDFYIYAEADPGWELFGWVVEDSNGVKRREMLRNQSDWRYNTERYRVWGEDNHLTVIFAEELFDLEVAAEYLIAAAVDPPYLWARDDTSARSYPEGWEVEISTETTRHQNTRHNDEFRGWTIQSVATGDYLNPEEYFADYKAEATTMRMPREHVRVNGEWAGWFHRMSEDFTAVAGILNGKLGKHYWDLSNVEPGTEIDFRFESKNDPGRYRVYYGTFESITSEMPGMLLFDSGWVSSYPRHVNESIYPGVDYPVNHPDVESTGYNVWDEAIYKVLIIKQAQFDYVLVDLENNSPDSNWLYSFRRTE